MKRAARQGKIRGRLLFWFLLDYRSCQLRASAGQHPRSLIALRLPINTCTLAAPGARGFERQKKTRCRAVSPLYRFGSVRLRRPAIQNDDRASRCRRIEFRVGRAWKTHPPGTRRHTRRCRRDHRRLANGPASTRSVRPLLPWQRCSRARQNVDRSEPPAAQHAKSSHACPGLWPDCPRAEHVLSMSGQPKGHKGCGGIRRLCAHRDRGG